MRSILGTLLDGPLFGTAIRVHIAFVLGGLLAAGGAVVALGVGGVAGMLALFVLVVLVLAAVGVISLAS